MSRKLTDNIDYTSRDYEAFKQLMIEKLQEKMPEYTDTSETDAGIVILEALANGLDILSLYADIVANDVVLPTTQSRNMAVILANSLGYIPYNQTASVYPQVFVLSTEQDNDYVIPRGTVIKTKDTKDLATIYYETIDDFVIPKGKLGNEKDENDNYIYTVDVASGQTINQDIIGTSTGAPLQSFVLNYTQVLVDTLTLFINEGDGNEVWTRVDSFYDADENSKVYTVSVDDFDRCTVQFGNGIKGKIPKSYANGISATYRIGGGEASNVSAQVITTLETGLPYIEETFNLSAKVLGHDKESLEDIKINAPASFRARNRLVTLSDYEDLLRINFYPLIAVKAIKDSTVSTKANLFYMIREDYDFSLIADEVDKFITTRQMLGSTYSINPYVEQKVNISAKLYTTADYDSDKLVEDIKEYLSGVTFAYGELKFGDTIVKSDLESEIKSTFDGILSFRISSPTQDIITPNAEQNVLRLGTVNITVTKI